MFFNLLSTLTDAKYFLNSTEGLLFCQNINLYEEFLGYTKITNASFGVIAHNLSGLLVLKLFSISNISNFFSNNCLKSENNNACIACPQVLFFSANYSVKQQ